MWFENIIKICVKMLCTEIESDCLNNFLLIVFFFIPIVHIFIVLTRYVELRLKIRLIL